jgi:hypothetical protein
MLRMDGLDFNAFDLEPSQVRERFRWARRQGKAAWLWPDVSVAAWQQSLRSIEHILSAVLTGQPMARLDGDSSAIGLACYTSGVGPLLGHWHEQGRISAGPEVAAVLELHLRHNRLRSARMQAAAITLVEALSKQDIAVVVLKGAHTGVAYFDAAGVRPASDVDFLVRGKDMDRAEAVMLAEGFSAGSRSRWESSWWPDAATRLPRSLQMVHADDPWSVDLHGSLNISAGAGSPVARLDDADPMSSSSRWPPCPAAAALDQPLLLLHLAAHAGAGLHNLSLLRLVEVALVCRHGSFNGSLSWDTFLEIGARTGASGYAFPALRLCEELAPGTVPGAVLEACADQVPPSALRLLVCLTPANAQRIERSSMAEHFMWSKGWIGRLRQIASDLLPSSSWRTLWSIYERRAWSLIRGRIRP